MKNGQGVNHEANWLLGSVNWGNDSHNRDSCRGGKRDLKVFDDGTIAPFDLRNPTIAQTFSRAPSVLEEEYKNQTILPAFDRGVFPKRVLAKHPKRLVVNAKIVEAFKVWMFDTLKHNSEFADNVLRGKIVLGFECSPRSSPARSSWRNRWPSLGHLIAIAVTLAT